MFREITARIRRFDIHSGRVSGSVPAVKLETKRGISRKEAYAEFAKTKEVAAAIAAIKAERATVSADDLLDEMNGGE